ncbi:DNA replication complex GINS protein PSF1 isoform X1 [Sesamum indicum]|uniref:DNA replication complex GINS protein PSF1 isoform X1 n=1 Tax=Sesamum indicum TaxID=4182 RepID=A0A6I9SQY2_SESIN|nr:DNA replication complex GINS protein PSF1 isoform X1 [Sesamum indicum]XP_011072236.1 DNA replication complex GINS protein PSF1 isoform X1 [Sesamum indicum]XP_011072237.1 DNA replication complex GINS protein PSF1 isoform X1 [Sesamum indicum]
MYARKASELVKEFASSEPGQLSTFNNDLFAQVLEECEGHLLHLQPLMRKIQEHENKLKDKRRSEDEVEISEDERRKSEAEKVILQTALKSDQFGALVHHLSLVRNKRCLMAYIYNRAEVIRSLGWMVDSVLPAEIEEKLSSTEKEYFKNHVATLQSYMSELDLHLTVDMVPPKDPYIKVRVLDDIGEVALSDQVANLARHAIMFLRRTDAEQYITQGGQKQRMLRFQYSLDI